MAIEADPEIYVEGETECTTQEFCISGPYVPNINPETDPDYIVALEHYNLAIQQAEQAITIFTPLYWTRLFHKWTQIAMEMETRTLMFSTLIIACQQLIACMVLGGVAMGLICVFLNFMGPIRIKMFATGIVALIIGTVVASGGVELAASTVIGIALGGYLFFMRISTGDKSIRVRMTTDMWNEFTGEANHSVFLFFHFWYVGNRTIFLHISQDEKVIGLI